MKERMMILPLLLTNKCFCLVQTASVTRFNILVNLLYILPLLNFYNFVVLAQRVVKIKFYYCDDYITGKCMVHGTYWWGLMIQVLAMVTVVIVLFHITLPPQEQVSACSRPGRCPDKFQTRHDSPALQPEPVRPPPLSPS